MFVEVVALRYRLQSTTTPTNVVSLFKELYILTGIETFAKEPGFLNLLRKLKSTPMRCY